MQPAQNLRALFLGRPAEIRECTLGCCDGTPRILHIGQRDAAYQFAARRTDDVHGLAAVGFDERSIDVVRRDRLDRVFRRYCFHCGVSFGSRTRTPPSLAVAWPNPVDEPVISTVFLFMVISPLIREFAVRT